MSKAKLDAIDRKILAVLQDDATVQIADLAARVGLSQTPCWRRVQRLKEAGVITREVVLVDRHAVNVGVTVFVSIKTNVGA
ncbi:winged helix-turn-helix DNA-binding domain-containing protein [Ditylenchus destructor]|nr:winged helix-turn-helix DNA-binding domain-containing protein [Ditylenchus destructor]